MLASHTQVFVEQYLLRPPWRPYTPDANYKSVSTLACFGRPLALGCAVAVGKVRVLL